MEQSKGQGITVVYVEDEPNIAQLLESGLGLFGIRVHPIYMSAEELLERTDQPEFNEADVLFFDIRLPKMTGVELATELRARSDQRPIVLVSAWPSPPRETLEALNARFLPKPFDFPDVIETIQKLAPAK
ncbi:MAG: response regulator [Anaerolineae bacterium]